MAAPTTAQINAAKAEARAEVLSIFASPEAKERPRTALAFAEQFVAGKGTLNPAGIRAELAKRPPESFDLVAEMRKRQGRPAGADAAPRFDLAGNMRQRYAGGEG